MRAAVHSAILILMLAGLFPQSSGAQPAPARSAPQDLQSPIGKVVAVAGSVSIEHTAAVVLQAKLVSGDRQAKIGDFVYRGDVLQTGAASKIDITFSDGTAFNVSSNARMVLNEYVYDPKGNSNSTFFSLVKGTFTFVVGHIAQTGDMRVDTPVGTAGIRGTTPRIEIAEDGSVTFSTLVEGNKTAASPTPGAPRPAPPR